MRKAPRRGLRLAKFQCLLFLLVCFLLPDVIADDLFRLWVANYYSARNPLRLSSLVILGVVARMFRCATRSSCWCT